MPFHPRATGYGHRAADVAAVQVDSGELLVSYHDAVHQQTTRYVGQRMDADLARIVDRSWDPPVSLGVRLVSVIATTSSTPARRPSSAASCSTAKPTVCASPQRLRDRPVQPLRRQRGGPLGGSQAGPRAAARAPRRAIRRSTSRPTSTATSSPHGSEGRLTGCRQHFPAAELVNRQLGPDQG